MMNKNKHISNRNDVATILFLLIIGWTPSVRAQQCHNLFNKTHLSTSSRSVQGYIEMAEKAKDPEHNFDDIKPDYHFAHESETPPTLLQSFMPKKARLVRNSVGNSKAKFVYKIMNNLYMPLKWTWSWTRPNGEVVETSTDLNVIKINGRPSLNPKHLVDGDVVLVHLHGGGTSTANGANASDVATNINKILTSVKKKIDATVMSFDLMGHGKGPQHEVQNFEEKIHWMFSLLRSSVAPETKIVISGHSWGAQYVDKIYQMLEQYNELNIVGLIALAPPSDGTFGKQYKDRKKYEAMVYDNIDQWAHKANIDDLIFTKNIVESGKIAIVPQLFTSISNFSHDWGLIHTPVQKLASKLPILSVNAEGDALVYTGDAKAQDLYWSHITQAHPLSQYHVLGRGKTFKANGVLTGHNVFDILMTKEQAQKMGVPEESPFIYNLMAKFLFEVAGNEGNDFHYKFTKKSDEAQDFNGRLINNMSKFIATYANNFAFRHFVKDFMYAGVESKLDENGEPITKIMSKKRSTYSNISSQAQKLAKKLSLELERFEKQEMKKLWKSYEDVLGTSGILRGENHFKQIQSFEIMTNTRRMQLQSFLDLIKQTEELAKKEYLSLPESKKTLTLIEKNLHPYQSIEEGHARLKELIDINLKQSHQQKANSQLFSSYQRDPSFIEKTEFKNYEEFVKTKEKLDIEYAAIEKEKVDLENKLQEAKRIAKPHLNGLNNYIDKAVRNVETPHQIGSVFSAMAELQLNLNFNKRVVIEGLVDNHSNQLNQVKIKIDQKEAELTQQLIHELQSSDLTYEGALKKESVLSFFQQALDKKVRELDDRLNGEYYGENAHLKKVSKERSEVRELIKQKSSELSLLTAEYKKRINEQTESISELSKVSWKSLLGTPLVKMQGVLKLRLELYKTAYNNLNELLENHFLQLHEKNQLTEEHRSEIFNFNEEINSAVLTFKEARESYLRYKDYFNQQMVKYFMSKNVSYFNGRFLSELDSLGFEGGEVIPVSRRLNDIFGTHKGSLPERIKVTAQKYYQLQKELLDLKNRHYQLTAQYFTIEGAINYAQLYKLTDILDMSVEKILNLPELEQKFIYKAIKLARTHWEEMLVIEKALADQPELNLN